MGRSGRRPALDRASLWQTASKGPSLLSCSSSRRPRSRRRPRPLRHRFLQPYPQISRSYRRRRPRRRHRPHHRPRRLHPRRLHPRRRPHCRTHKDCSGRFSRNFHDNLTHHAPPPRPPAFRRQRRQHSFYRTFVVFYLCAINDKLYFYLICPKTGEHPWCKFAAVTSPTAAATTRTTRLPRRRRRSVNVVVSLFHCSDVELNCFTVPTKLRSLFRVNSSSPRKFM